MEGLEKAGFIDEVGAAGIPVAPEAADEFKLLAGRAAFGGVFPHNFIAGSVRVPMMFCSGNLMEPS